jgi:hypothetical protein
MGAHGHQQRKATVFGYSPQHQIHLHAELSGQILLQVQQKVHGRENLRKIGNRLNYNNLI